MKIIISLILSVILMLSSGLSAMADEKPLTEQMPAQTSEVLFPEVALIIQLRGKAMVERQAEEAAFEAVIKSPIELRDVIETLRKSRAKMLFKDESIMTLGSESRASVREFVRGLEGEGATVFNLMEGKMRTVVGKTRFEVHTPTVVAAARGTVIEFIVGEKGNRAFTVITCLEGTVEISSLDPEAASLTLSAGYTITVFEGEDPSTMTPVPTYLYEGLPGGRNMVTSIVTEAIDSIETQSARVEFSPHAGTVPVIVDVIFPGEQR